MIKSDRVCAFLCGARRLWSEAHTDPVMQLGFALSVTGIVFGLAFLAGSLVTGPRTVQASLQRLGYDLTEVRGGEPVAPVFLARLPGDLEEIQAVETRKDVFFRIMLPIVLRENARVWALRQQIRKDPESIEAEVYERYGIDEGDAKRLLLRVDTVPPSLALSQAAIESGWGTSRFVKVANNLFGHRTYDDEVAGVAPKGVNDPDFKVREFDGIAASVRAYLRNLNTHPAYAGLRRKRAALRRAGKRPDGVSLARELGRYSERGDEYVQQVIRVIRQNNLLDFDEARLGS